MCWAICFLYVKWKKLRIEVPLALGLPFLGPNSHLELPNRAQHMLEHHGEQTAPRTCKYYQWLKAFLESELSYYSSYKTEELLSP